MYKPKVNNVLYVALITNNPTNRVLLANKLPEENITDEIISGRKSFNVMAISFTLTEDSFLQHFLRG